MNASTLYLVVGVCLGLSACDTKTAASEPATAETANTAKTPETTKKSETAKAPAEGAQPDTKNPPGKPPAAAGPNLACDLLTPKALQSVLGIEFLAGKSMPLRDISHGAHKCQFNADPDKKGNASVVVIVHTQGWDAAKKRASAPEKEPHWKPVKGYGKRAELRYEPTSKQRKEELASKILAQVGDRIVEVELVKFTMDIPSIATELGKLTKIVVTNSTAAGR